MNGRLIDDQSMTFIGRNWTRYFSQITRVDQLQALDSFLLSQVLYAMRKRELKATKEYIKSISPSFVNLHYKMKRMARQHRKKLTREAKLACQAKHQYLTNYHGKQNSTQKYN